MEGLLFSAEGERHQERMKEKDKDGWGRDEEESRWDKTSSENTGKRAEQGADV